MSNDNNSEVDYSQLYVYAGPEQPDPSNMKVYASETVEFLSHPLQANIIGSSHYISIPGLGYREITSCRPINMVRDFRPVVMQYTIDGDAFVPEPYDYIKRHAGPFEVGITIDAQGHNPNATFDDWDLCYTFEGDGPSAPTAINFFKDSWRTVHVYPEFGVDLYTKTTFMEW